MHTVTDLPREVEVAFLWTRKTLERQLKASVRAWLA